MESGPKQTDSRQRELTASRAREVLGDQLATNCRITDASELCPLDQPWVAIEPIARVAVEAGRRVEEVEHEVTAA